MHELVRLHFSFKHIAEREIIRFSSPPLSLLFALCHFTEELRTQLAAEIEIFGVYSLGNMSFMHAYSFQNCMTLLEYRRRFGNPDLFFFFGFFKMTFCCCCSPEQNTPYERT